MTDAELKLWNELRAQRLMGLAFRRQFPIAGYIVDFACPTYKLIVEIDGSQHSSAEHVATDLQRTKRLEQDGWTVLRFWNDDVLRDIDNVCQHIVIAAGERTGGHGGTAPPSVLPDISPTRGEITPAANTAPKPKTVENHP